MDTYRLRQFCYVVESGGLSNAAKIIGISHSGLSKSMSALSRELGFDLFVPQGRGIAVTDLGKALYPEAKEIIRRVSGLKKPKNKLSDEPLKIGALEVFLGHGMFARLAKHFQTENGMMPVQLIELSPGQLELAILDGYVQFGISYVPSPQEGIEYLQIGIMKMGVFRRKGRFENLSIEQIPFVVPHEAYSNNPLGVKMRDGWPAGEIERLTPFKTNLLSVALDVVRNGDAAVYVPTFVASNFNRMVSPEHRLVQVDLPKTVQSMSRKIYLLKKSTTAENKEAKKLAAAIREYCAG